MTQSNPAPDTGPVRFYDRLWFRIAFFAGFVLFLGMSRMFLSFWPRYLILAAWAIGLALLFIRALATTRD